MGLFKKIGEKLVGKEDTLVWDRKETPESNPQRGLVYRVPNKEFPDMRRIKNFGVRDYERCLFYRTGALQAVLEGGIYEVDKEARNKATEIVWVDTGIVDVPWGIPHFQGLMTSELIKIGMNGNMKIRVSEPAAFITRVVAYKKDFTDQVTKEFISGLMITSLRDIVKNYTLRNFLLSNREDIKGLSRTKFSQEFKDYGLELISMDILGQAFPPEVQNDVDDILGETRADISNLREEKARLEDAIKRMKLQLEELEEQYAAGNIDDEEFDKKENRINKIFKRREEDLKKIQSQIDEITKNKGIQN
ncbi:MAG: SPFH domain-containing protein [Candidatus Hodarchaeales archaeon]|jgi:regulator of protease activity HflC (stomatin/prohibitin superfamily)